MWPIPVTCRSLIVLSPLRPSPGAEPLQAVRTPDGEQWCEQILLSSSPSLELHPAALLLAPSGGTRLIRKNRINNALRSRACVQIYLWFTGALKEPSTLFLPAASLQTVKGESPSHCPPSHRDCVPLHIKGNWSFLGSGINFSQHSPVYSQYGTSFCPSFSNLHKFLDKELS